MNEVAFELVRGSTDRVKLDWSRPGGHTGIAPDAYVYSLQSEYVSGEQRVYWPLLPEAAIKGCPYGSEASRAEARKVCEWHCWMRLTGKPAASPT